MPLVIVRHRVRDIAAWKARFEADGPARDAAGLTGVATYVDADDRNMVVVLIPVPSLPMAKGSMASEPLRASMAEAGVLDEPQVIYLEEI